MIISVDTAKGIWQNQQPFMIKIQENLGIQVLLAFYGKPVANINLNGETQKAFPLKSGKRQGWALFP